MPAYVICVEVCSQHHRNIVLGRYIQVTFVQLLVFCVFQVLRLV